MLLAALGSGAGLPLAQAETPASPIATGQALRQQERERLLRAQQERVPDVRLSELPTERDPERLPAEELPCLDIQRIVLAGDSADRFQWALAAAGRTEDGAEDPALGRCLGSRGVNLVMRRIQNAILARGYVAARVLAGPQESLADGTLELTLFPGRIREIRFVPESGARATQWNAMPASPGDLLNLRDIEQALENFKRVPSAQADIQITAAEGPQAQPGQSDVLIRWEQGFPFRASLFADDSGTRATGKYQGGITLSYDHWWTLNDLFYVSLNHDLGGADAAAPGKHGTRGYTVHYSLPLGYWLLGATASRNRYHQSVAGASQTYVYSGISRNGEIRLSRLLYRDAVRKTWFALSGWARSSRNFIDDTEVEVQRRRMAGWELGISHREFIGAATLDASLDYRRGTGAGNAMPAPEEAFGEGTSRPRLIAAQAQFHLPFTLGGEALRYTGAWRAQWNRTPLVPQDRFAIGGRYSVRGFDGESQLLGERGWLVRNDLGWALGQSGQELYLGLDAGQVGGPGSRTLAGKRLCGMAVGLRGHAHGISYDVFAGWPLSQPDGFRTPSSVAGFSLGATF
ncbi:MAG: ShlB/FhaC/HecB family hemolysin secretion/activation protein [Noviherbaspirillum sp.]